MSGCFPTEVKCKCTCHLLGIRHYLTSNPPQVCCDCYKDINEKMMKGEEQDVSPMVKKIQELDKQIDNLADNLAGFMNGFPKANEIFVEANVNNINKRIDNLEDSIKENHDLCISNNGVLCKDLYKIEERLNHQQGDFITVNDRLIELESHVKQMTEACLRKVIDNVKPHRCPVCDGKPLTEVKIQKTLSGLDKLIIECHGCNGTGIVWG